MNWSLASCCLTWMATTNVVWTGLSTDLPCSPEVAYLPHCPAWVRVTAPVYVCSKYVLGDWLSRKCISEAAVGVIKLDFSAVAVGEEGSMQEL